MVKILKIPDSMEEVVYWTSRKVDEGHVKAWAFKEMCPECHKALMSKPTGKDGKVKIRATYYECSECGHTIDKKPYEDSLTCSIIYTCPYCKHKGEAQVPFKRKNFKGVKSIVFECDSCKEKIPVTKKMKELK